MTSTPLPERDPQRHDDSFEPPHDWNPDADTDDDREEIELGVEVTAVKASASFKLPVEKVSPNDPPPPPTSGKELWARVKPALLEAVARTAELVPEIPDTAIMILHGVKSLTKIPQAIGQSLTRGRNKAIAREEQAQQKLEEAETNSETAVVTQEPPAETPIPPAQKVDTTLEQLEVVLNRLRADGVHAQIVEQPDGTFAVIAVRPELAEKAIELASEAIANLEMTPKETPELQGGSLKLTGGNLEVPRPSSSDPVPINGAKLRELRAAAGLTQKALAEVTDVSASTISRIERGEVETTSQETVDRLASALDVTSAELI